MIPMFRVTRLRNYRGRLRTDFGARVLGGVIAQQLADAETLMADPGDMLKGEWRPWPGVALTASVRVQGGG